MAEGPLQLEQIEPGKGEWLAEYFGFFGDGDSRQHGVELFYGVSRRLALGVEVEGEVEDGTLEFSAAEITGIYRLSGDNAPVAIALQANLGFGEGEEKTTQSLALLLEQKNAQWWSQANFILARNTADEAEDEGTQLSYGWNLSYAVVDDLWLGLEGSGHALRLAGFEGLYEATHFAGPALTTEFALSPESEVEIGLAYLRGLNNAASDDNIRLFIQFEF